MAIVTFGHKEWLKLRREQLDRIKAQSELETEMDGPTIIGDEDTRRHETRNFSSEAERTMQGPLPRVDVSSQWTEAEVAWWNTNPELENNKLKALLRILRKNPTAPLHWDEVATYIETVWGELK
jgi:hypothetical protein